MCDIEEADYRSHFALVTGLYSQLVMVCKIATVVGRLTHEIEKN